jgi:hypothetical protein
MRKPVNLSLAALGFLLLLGLFYWEAQFFGERSLLAIKAMNYETQKAQIALVIVSFHSYYHVWPCPEGTLGTSALEELTGLDEARINTQHIDFFEKNHVSVSLVDPDDRPLQCKFDDKFGTCFVTGAGRWDSLLTAH